MHRLSLVHCEVCASVCGAVQGDVPAGSSCVAESVPFLGLLLACHAPQGEPASQS